MMPATKMSLPHERRKAQLKSAKLSLQVRIAENREKLARVNEELRAMAPKKKAADSLNLTGRR